MTTHEQRPAPAHDWPPPRPLPSAPPRRYGRFENEVMAGGSVTERPREPVGGGPAGTIGGLAILALLAWLGVTNLWMFLFVVGILVSVFLHELGHFVTARMTGMKATQFFIGFGPRLWSFHRGETEYGVRLLPLGAFVRIVGMNNLDDVPPEDEGRTYRQKSYPRRLLVISAGSIMHLLLAVVLFFGVFAVKGERVSLPGAEIDTVREGTPAATIGLQPGDIIVSVGDVAVTPDVDLGEAVRSYEPGVTVPVVFVRGDEEHTTSVTLMANDEPEHPFRGSAFLGVSSFVPYGWNSLSLSEAATSSVTELLPTTWQSTQGVVKVLNPVNVWEHVSGTNQQLETRPTTLVGVTQVSGAIGESEGIAGLFLLLALVNVFVGVFNMFPLLPLDGGHAAIATYERVRELRTGGRRYFTDVSKLLPFTMGVLAVLLFLFMSGLYLDITKPL